VNLLLDTHALIWLLEGDLRLSQTARSAIEDPQNTNFISIATFWEIAIKTSLGKLETKTPLSNLKHMTLDNGIEILPITIEHTLIVSDLAFHHRDPFDRLLIAQAIHEKMSVLSRDEHFKQYAIHIIW
jgi:PIN domain nuclease of toxin-antitoxin system